MDLRLFTDPYEQQDGVARWVVQLCDEGAWHDWCRHGTTPGPNELVVASVRLVFLTEMSAQRDMG